VPNNTCVTDFKIFSVFCFLISFWVIPRRLNFMYRRSGILCSIFIGGVHFQAQWNHPKESTQLYLYGWCKSCSMTHGLTSLRISAKLQQHPTHTHTPTSVYEWISREPVAWPWHNLAASQRRPYCASVNSHSPVGASQLAVRRRWLSLCNVWPSHSQWPSEQIRFITTIRLLIVQLTCRLFGKASHHPGLSAPLTAQIWLHANSGFSQS